MILKSSSRLEHPMGVRQPVDAKNAGHHLRVSSRGFSFFISIPGFFKTGLVKISCFLNASKKIKLSLTRFSKIQVYITVEYLKMTARSSRNSFGAELGHLVKVSKILFQ